MNLLPIFILLVLTATAAANPFVITGVATNVLSMIQKIIWASEKWSVIVENQGKHHAHVWCASRDDRIGNENGIWLAPGQSLGWAFRRHRRTQFWCTMDWWGQRVGWDVYVANWHDAPNPTRWLIRDDGVYDEWRGRIWRRYRSD